MPEMTLTEAATWAGKTRSTVFKAIKGGRLSARRTDDGQWMIDPAELARVYPPAGAGNTPRNGAGEQADTARDTAEIEGLRTLNAVLQETVRDLRTERDRLLGVVEAQQRLLADQSKRETAPETEAKQSWWPWRRKRRGP
jgi:hypothetical protein